MNVDKMTLYIQDASRAIRYWSIWAEDFEIFMAHGTLGGDEQIQSEYIEYGLGSRSREEQVISRINSRLNRKKDKGYTVSLDDARLGRPMNAMGYQKPMLAAKYHGASVVDFRKVFVQYKYDGHRCLIVNDGGKFIAYSRNGKPVHTVDHITKHFADIPEGTILDGELYVHGMKLQHIGSLVKKQQSASSLLRFHCYDLIEDIPFSERASMIEQFELGPNGIFVPTWRATETGISSSTIHNHLKAAKEAGYEGLMLRVDGPGYEDGKRSKQLLKVKSVIDDEYLVLQITASKDNWAILHCVMPSGKKFSVSAPGDMQEKENVLRNKEKYIGAHVTVECAGFTEDGKPFHPVATAWREIHTE